MPVFGRIGPMARAFDFVATKNTQLSIDIATSIFSGHLTVDGKPAPSGQSPGTLYFANADSFYYRRVLTDDSGAFYMRVPKGNYKVYFEVDTGNYPEYARGTQLMGDGIELATDQTLEMDYVTVPVTEHRPEPQPATSARAIGSRATDQFRSIG